jgi:CspA family cold shock protein
LARIIDLRITKTGATKGASSRGGVHGMILEREMNMTSGVKNGTVKWFDVVKGYGFIEAVGVDEDIFVHYSAVPGREGERNLTEGDMVTFVLDKKQDGRLFASEVKTVVRSNT